MRKFYSLLCLLLFFIAGMGEVLAASPTLDQILKADQITAGKRIVLRGLKNNNPWINIVANNSAVLSEASVFVVESAEGGFYLQHESTGQYLKAYNGANSTIGVTTLRAEAGIFQVSNPTFNNEADMNWLDPEQDHSLLTRFTSKGTSMFINTQGAAAKAIYAPGTGGWSIMYVYDAANIDFDAPEDDSEFFEGDADKFYLISSINDVGAYMAETGDGRLSTATYENQNKVFWKLIPTGTEGRFYVKNATSGRYIQSSKQTLSSQIPMGTGEVEYQIGKDMSTGATTSGHYYFCSTDQQNIPTGAIGLNYDKGNTKNVVAWSAKSGDKNSYWRIQEVAYTYEPQIVPLVENIEDVDQVGKYTLNTADGKQLVAEGGTLALADKGADWKYAWVFVGTSNAREGIYLVNMAAPAQVLTVDAEGNYSFAAPEEGTRWYAAEKEVEGKTVLVFVPYAQKDEADAPYLTVGGLSEFTLGNYRSAYSLATQIYSLPCGSLDNGYLTQVGITGEQVLRELGYAATAAPSSYYTLYTTEKATVSAGQTFTLAATVAGMDEDVTVFVYFDWNRDGLFETMYTYNEAQIAEEITVPEEAVLGKSRMRVRVTNNALTDAEDDVIGSVYDFIVNIAEPQAQRTIAVKANDPERGMVEILIDGETCQTYTGDYGTEITVMATPDNQLEFIAWKDDRTVVSTDEEYRFTITENADLTACFSPNSTLATDIQGTVVDQDNFVYEIKQGTQEIQVVTDAEVKMVYVFGIDGTQLRKSAGKQISVAGLSQGTYIVKVVTTAGDGSKKITLK